MTISEISKCAAGGILPEAPMDCPERCLFYSLRDIYSENKAGHITKDEGKKRKQEAIGQYQRDCTEFFRGKHILEHHARMWAAIELAGNNYRKEPTIEHADAFITAVYGVGRKQEKASA